MPKVLTTDEITLIANHRRGRWDDTVTAFIVSEDPGWDLTDDFPGVIANNLRSGLNGAVRKFAPDGSVKVAQRGNRVYLYRNSEVESEA